MGASEIDARLEEQLIDGILYAFQEQTQEVGFKIIGCLLIDIFRILSCSMCLAQFVEDWVDGLNHIFLKFAVLYFGVSTTSRQKFDSKQLIWQVL